MKNLEGWSFRDRSFVTALALSILWHAFWFFSLTITVKSNKKFSKNNFKIVSLGPVLDDKIFRTLVQARPEPSKTFYRRLSDYSSPVDIQTKTAERYTPGSVVSLPFGMRTWNKVKGLIGGSKASPEHEFSQKIKIEYSEESAGIDGELKNRPILSHPNEPVFPVGMDPIFKTAEVVINLTVDKTGAVTETQIASSSGNPELDLLWARYVRGWQFAPLSVEDSRSDQKGTTRFQFTKSKE